MAKSLLIIVASTIVCVLSEPPVGEYLPPGQQGGNGYSRSSSARSLSTTYGAPSTSRFGGSGSSYHNGASSRFGGAGSSYNNGASSSRFSISGSSYHNGASSRFSGAGSSYQNGASSRFSGAGSSYNTGAASSRFSSAGISSQYSAPSVTSARFNDNSAHQSARSFASSRYTEPSTQYGAPSMTSSRFGGSPSTQYGAPSAASSRFNSVSSGPSTQYGAPSPVYGAPFGRSALQEDPLSEPANYEFGYDVQDPESGSEFGQEETRQDESARGSYRVLLPDGRLQIVEYEADEEGYKPVISYEDTNNGPYPSSRGSQGGPY